MKAEPKRPPRIVEIEGTPCVRVEAARGEVVTLDRDAWERLLQEGFSGNLYVNRDGHSRAPCVKMRNTRRHPSHVSVSKWVAGGTREQQVSYRNGNRLDLRRANLALVDRRGPRVQRAERPLYVPQERGLYGEEGEAQR